jgi:hypothetical protein
MGNSIQNRNDNSQLVQLFCKNAEYLLVKTLEHTPQIQEFDVLAASIWSQADRDDLASLL